ncbi:hypothetical protein CANMA_002417 [Candida margitis]|uniref:uncharacterized protein n=1 Tax=Candida margitis TaxID=1775924 RepID=UPI002227D2C0|nr:uncharacterized protein CANMA_002417 [Candida margitis]KAI5968201.1 hypothetical protein CANMA_002417 [Candida margitis]
MTSVANSTDQEKGPLEDHVEKISTHESPLASISEEHKQYLIAKHGTYALDPLPSMSDDDPLNWSDGFKYLQLGMVAFHGFMGTFMASGIVPSFGKYSEILNKPVPTVSYLTSAQIVLIGTFPMIWVPVMQRYGKRLLLIISVLGTMAFSIGAVFSTDYGTLMAMRCLSAVFVSPGLAVGGAIVKETTFSHQRGSRSGIWAISVNLGTMFGALFMGFVAEYQHPKYVHVVFASIMFVQAVCYFLLGKETSYNPNDLSRNETNRFKQLRFKAIFPENKITVLKVLEPLTFLFKPRVFIPAFGYTIMFMHGNIAMNVEIPQVMVHKFGMDPQALGLQFISFIIGTLIGEVGGYLSDKLVQWGHKNNKGPSFRLWVTHPGYITCILGLIIFGVQIQNIDHYNVTPLIGCAIASFGLQVGTSPIIAYCIDSDHTKAVQISLFVTFLRQLFAFIGPFYFPKMFDNLGFAKAYGIMAALVGGLGWITTICLQFYEQRRGR